MTTTRTRKGQVAVFIVENHRNAECAGVHAARHSTVTAQPALYFAHRAGA